MRNASSISVSPEVQADQLYHIVNELWTPLHASSPSAEDIPAIDFQVAKHPTKPTSVRDDGAFRSSVAVDFRSSLLWELT